MTARTAIGRRPTKYTQQRGPAPAAVARPAPRRTIMPSNLNASTNAAGFSPVESAASDALANELLRLLPRAPRRVRSPSNCSPVELAELALVPLHGNRGAVGPTTSILERDAPPDRGDPLRGG